MVSRAPITGESRVRLVLPPVDGPAFHVDWTCLLRFALRKVPKGIAATVQYILESSLASASTFPQYVLQHYHNLPSGAQCLHYFV